MTRKRTQTAPESGEILLSDAAKRLGLSLQAAGLWAKKPGAPARAEGRHVYVRWPDFARWREHALIAAAMPGDVDGLRAEKLRVEITMAELDLAQRRGELVTVADFETALGAVLDLLMGRLRGLPVRLAHFGPQVEAEAEAEVEHIITELHNWNGDVLPEEDGEETPSDAAPAA